MAKMGDSTLKALLADKITNSLGFFGGRIAKERLKAMQYYYGQPFGNEVEGSSQVISRDVAEVVEASMPSLLRIFAAGDDVVKYEPSKPGQEKQARQATDYANWVWNTQNEGFRIFHDWFKDALLQKLGVIKIWWDEEDDIKKETYRGLTQIQCQILDADPDVDVIEEAEYTDPTGQVLYDKVVQRKHKKGRIKIVPIPPEEFLLERRAVDLNDVTFAAHRVRKTVSDLIEMGYPSDVVRSLPSEEGEYNMERLERFYKEDELPYRNISNLDETMREVWVTECYVRLDYDGDGVAEFRKVTVAGADNNTILDNEEVDDHPFAAITPFMMPHKLIGESIPDFTTDIQLIKSTLWRQALDNLYNANTPRLGVVESQVNLDDLLTPRAGGVVRMNAPGMIEPIMVPNIAGNALQMVEYIDTVREKRTGISAYNQGLDADTLNKTAMGIQMIQEAGNQRLELIARVFAETGVKRAFRRILELACKHNTQPTMIRLRGQWIDMDPREWSDEYDISISVGLGSGNKQANFQQIMSLLQLDAQIISLQGGVQGPILTLQNVYEKLKRLVEATGRKDTDAFYTDPSTVPPQPPQQPQMDPKVQAQLQSAAIQDHIAQMKAQSNIAVAQVQAQSKMYLEELKAHHQMALDQYKTTMGGGNGAG